MSKKSCCKKCILFFALAGLVGAGRTIPAPTF